MKIFNWLLALSASLMAVCLMSSNAFGQQVSAASSLSEDRATIHDTSDSGKPTSSEKVVASDAERIAALEEALRLQSAQLEQLRSSLAEQSRLLNELRTLASRNQPAPGTISNDGNAAVIASDKAGDATAATQQKPQASITDRVVAVEAQAKKTSEALSKQLGSFSFSGDVRLRFESFFGLSNALPNAADPSVLGNELTPRFRPRIRARLNMRGQINDQVDWGLRIATGSFGDNISTNQTLTDFLNRKPFALDQAFITYRPKQLPGLRLQAGKFETPWAFTEMTFDSDLTVEGINEQYSRDFKGTLKNLTFLAWQSPLLERNSAFVRNSDGTVNIDQSRRAGRDLALYGGQVRARFEPSDKVGFTLSVADLYFSGTQFISPIQVFGNQLQLPVTITIPGTPTTPPQTITTQVLISRDLLVAGNANLGLTNASNNAINRDGRLSSGYNLVDVLGRLDLKYNKRFPVALFLDFVTNTQTRDVVLPGPGGLDLIVPNHENNGFGAQVQVGQTKERGDMLFDYTFARIEKDAVLTPFNFSDVTQQSDMRAHRFIFSYAADPRVTLSFIGIVTERVHGLLGAFGNTPPGSLNRSTTRIQFDSTFRF
jgi:Putative porin